MPMAKKAVEVVTDKQFVEAVKLLDAAEVPADIYDNALNKEVPAPKAVAFGRNLSDYEILKDRRIAAAGVVQSLSQVYIDQAMGLKPDKVDEYVENAARRMLDLIMKLASEGK